MTLKDFDYSLYVDYRGKTLDEESGKERAIIGLLLYVLQEKNPPHKRYGINLSSDPSDDLEECIKLLSERTNRFFAKRYPNEEPINLVEELGKSEKLKRTFARWQSMRVDIAEREKKVEVELEL